MLGPSCLAAAVSAGLTQIMVRETGCPLRASGLRLARPGG